MRYNAYTLPWRPQPLRTEQIYFIPCFVFYKKIIVYSWKIVGINILELDHVFHNDKLWSKILNLVQFLSVNFNRSSINIDLEIVSIVSLSSRLKSFISYFQVSIDTIVASNKDDWKKLCSILIIRVAYTPRTIIISRCFFLFFFFFTYKGSLNTSPVISSIIKETSIYKWL